MEKIMQINGLSGGYFLTKPVLHDVSFFVGKGEMVGLIGLNGAGKSTAIKHILGLMDPQRGSIEVAGITLRDSPEAYRSAFAYVPESPEFYEELTIREHLELTALAYGVSKDLLETRMQHLLQLFRMEEKVDSFSRHLSKGMRQKLMLMNAFLPEPPLYIIDEPFLGLDPLGIRSLLDQMVSFKKQGASFLISSHILSTIEHYCERFVVLHQGKVLAQGSLEELRHSAELPGASLEDIFFTLVERGDAK